MIIYEGLLLLLAYYVILFIIGQILHDNSIVDMVWGLGFVVLALYLYFRVGDFNLNKSLVTLLVTLWGLRLTYYITKRNWGKGEDFRYVNFRKKWGNHWSRLKAFLQVYLLQMTMLIIIASSFVNTIVYGQNHHIFLQILGIVIWIIGFSFECIADYQLKVFKSNPENKSKLLTSGLRAYTRHPNYFGESLLWWGIWILCLRTPYAWLTIISPITITVLVRFVSGVPLLEEHYAHREDYQIYAQKTPVFIPRFRKD